jgi:hypothetical protein
MADVEEIKLKRKKRVDKETKRFIWRGPGSSAPIFDQRRRGLKFV